MKPLTRSANVLLLFLVLVVPYANNASINDGKIGLYGSDDEVEILTISNFKQEVYGNKRALYIEFYNSWCGFCKRFAPSWVALAKDVLAWSDLVGIAAIDCSNDDNNPICRDFEIMGYPTLKYIHENYVEGPSNTGVKLKTGEGVDEHRLHLIEQIVKEQNEGRAQQFPKLSPYEGNDAYSLFEDVGPNVQYVFLIVQDPASYVGQELILDYHRLENISIKYAHKNSYYENKLQSQNINNLPAVLFLDRNKNLYGLPIGNPTPNRNDLKIALEGFLKSKNFKIPEVIHHKKEIAQTIESNEHDYKRELKENGDAVYQMDLENALRYALKHETARKIIADERLEALKKFVDLLVRYFPFGINGKALLRDIRDHLNSQTSVKGSDISKMVKEAEGEGREVFSSPPQWLACKGSSDTFRGYPCGLWKLFHYLTVNAALDPPSSNPKVVLEAMHGYIKHYFGCADCSEHFLAMAQEREMDKVSSFDESILWLWGAHNQVNNRLHGDPTEDPEFPKIQFPSKSNCPECYDVNNNFVKPEVLRYLKHMYSSVNVKHLGSDMRVLHLGLQGSAGPSLGNFRMLDECMYIGLCIISFVLLIALVRFVLRRGYRKKRYPHDLYGKV